MANPELRLTETSSHVKNKNTDDPYETFTKFQDVIRYPRPPDFNVGRYSSINPLANLFSAKRTFWVAAQMPFATQH